MHQHHHQSSQQQQPPQQATQKHNEHWPQSNTNTATTATCTAEYSLPFNQQDPHASAQPQQHHRHQHMPRKQSAHGHSHSPHPSRHTSPHSRHTSPHSRHTSPHSRHTSPHSRHTSPHSRHTSPHSRHTSPHSRHTSPHSRHTSPHGGQHGHSHAHGHSHTSPHQSAHHHVHDQQHHQQNGTDTAAAAEPFVRNSALRASVRSTSSHIHPHHHSHHHHRRRKRGPSNGNNGTSAADIDRNQTDGQHHHEITAHSVSRQGNVPGHTAHHTCTRRHRSVTDLSNTSLNTCNDPSCTDREVQEIFVHKSSTCCTGSRPELAQYFAEDLYGSSSRRPSSCCTSSDYCYQTDSTSLYGSRSSLSRNNSVKSASVTMRKKKMSQQRQPSYHSISLRALNDSRPSSNMGSLASIFDRAKQYAENGEKLHGSASKVTIERQTSKDALSNDLPEYACSPSPIRWSFLADGKTAKETNGATTSTSTTQRAVSKSKEATESKRQTRSHHQQPLPQPHHHQQQPTLAQPRKPERAHKESRAAEHPQKPPRSQSQHRKSISIPSDDRPSTSRKCCESPCKYEESTMVQFHQDAEAFNNCCSNYIQCNTYLDQDLQITSEDIHHYLAKGQQDVGNILNNTKTYPFQPSNALEFQYKNNFANNNTATNTLSSVEGAESMRSYDSRFRRNSSKETNLNQNSTAESCTAACAISSANTTNPLSPANINLSSSTNNINIVFSSSTERNANEVKFINTTSRTSTSVVSSEGHHSTYLPYSYPTYDYTNMSTNSTFDKPLGIDEIPTSMHRSDDTTGGTTSSSQHSSSLHSPEPQGVSFESFDATSGHNLISSHRGSCQYSPTTPRSPLSPGSPAASSTYSASINPSTTSYVHLQQHHPHYDYPPGIQRSHVHAHTHAHSHHHIHDHHLRESFKISNALKKVRKRARKYTDFLRKK